MTDLCDNGRQCGKGKIPECPREAIHFICAADDGKTRPIPEPIKLCEKCFQNAMSLGLIDSPYMSKEVFDQNEKERKKINAEAKRIPRAV